MKDRVIVRRITVVLVIAIISISGCGYRTTLNKIWLEEHPASVLAVADGGFEMKSDDFYNTISAMRVMMNGGVMDAEASSHLLDSILLDTLAGLAAREVNLADHYYQYDEFKKQYFEYLIKAYWQETVYKYVTADSLESVEFYKEHPEHFSVEEQVNLYHILSSPFGLTIGPDSVFYKELKRDELWNAAKEYADKMKLLLDWGVAFENVAYDFSHDVASREVGGYIGWTKRNSYLEPFDSVAFSLKEGEYSEPYRDKDGWHLIMIANYMPTGPLPIDSPQVLESAYQTLLTAKSNKIVGKRLDSLRLAINVVANPLILDTNIHLVEDSIWAGIVNGMDTLDCRELKRFEEGFRKRYKVDNTTSEMKMEMLTMAGGLYIQLQAARAHGIDTLPRVVKERDRLWNLRAKNIVSKSQHDFVWQPSMEEIEKYYMIHKAEYVVKNPYTVVYVTANDSDFASFLQEQVESGLEPDDVVRENVTSELRATSSGVIKGRAETFAPALFTIIARTRVGRVSSLLKTKNGEYQFVKVLSVKHSKDLTQASGEIRTILKRKHSKKVWNDYKKGLYAKFNLRFVNRPGLIELDNYFERNPDAR